MEDKGKKYYITGTNEMGQICSENVDHFLQLCFLLEKTYVHLVTQRFISSQGI
jgi:hypothetical protein